MNYTFFKDLIAEVGDLPADSIVSRTLYRDDTIKVVLFGFAPGQGLSEHSSSRPALVHFLHGEATLQLGDNQYEVGANAWAHMPPGLPHSIHAKTETRMLLILL
jgi:quercetin dioxygenase-like cupin family protein